MNNLKIIKGLLLEPFIYDDERFSDLYIALRLREGRLFDSREIAELPSVPRSHAYYKEWKVRRHSCNRLLHYIKSHGHACNILDIGCGNGWLSAKLSQVACESVTGLDINNVEIEQARKVFRKIQTLKFIPGDIRSGILRDKKFDVIVFAASIQYFQSLQEIVEIALDHLTLQGEIHILDSHLYRANEVESAQLRSLKYFTEIGFREMADLYFHHTLDELKAFSFSVLHNPASWRNRLMPNSNPFHWIVIKNTKP